MKLSVVASLLTAGVLVSGCASHKPKTPPPAPQTGSMIVTPDTSLAASVVRSNPTGRFVVLNFPVGRMPAGGQTLFLYRAGLKQGEVRISGPQQDTYVVADVVSGDAQVGDEVRDQ